MAQKNKKKRVNLTPQELMEREQIKSAMRNPLVQSFISGDDLQKVAMVDVDRPNLSEVQSRRTEINESKKLELATVNKPSKQKNAIKTASLLLTVADVCALLKLSRSTVSRMEKNGALPGRVKIGGTVRYSREIIENWIRDL